MINARFGSATAILNLILVKLKDSLLELAHFFNLIQINHKAFLLVVEVFNTFAAKDGRVL
jgi:hypothetical protein